MRGSSHIAFDPAQAGLSTFGIGLPELAVACLMLSVIGLFLVSPLTLESSGIAYLTSGGGIASKCHPATLLAFAALGFRCLAARNPLHAVWRIGTSDPGVVLLTASVIVAAFCAVTIDHVPVTPLIDTFVLPVVVFLLLRDLDPRLMRWLAFAIALVMAMNAIMAITEFLRGAHFLTIDIPVGASSDPTRADTVFDWRAELAQDWRATALMGHPLANGLVTGAFIICLAAPGSNWIPSWITLPMLALQLVAILAFGARAALVLSIAATAWLAAVWAVDAIAQGRRIQPRQIAVGALAVCIVAAVAIVLVQTGFADRTLDRFSSDNGSASTRITMFNLFQPLSISDMLFGPDSDLVLTWQRLEGLEFGIESSWVGLALTFGLIVTGMIVVGLCAFTLSVVRTSGRGAVLVMALYFILVSVSASMSGKTTTFAMAISLTMVFLHKDERRDPMWSPAHVRSA